MNRKTTTTKKPTVLWVSSLGDILRKGFSFSLVSLMGRAGSPGYPTVGYNYLE